MEVGIDCIDISRFEESSLLMKRNLKRMFTEKEITYCQNKEHPSQHYAVRFAAKEAIQKAFTNYNVKIPLNDIEIVHQKNGIPYAQINHESADDYIIKISLSHSKTTAVSIAIISKR